VASSWRSHQRLSLGLFVRHRSTVFREYFIAAQDFLRKQGLNPILWRAKSVSQADIARVDQLTDRPMPAELRRFYTEMGDAFEFVPDDVPNSPLEGWEPNHLSDYAIWNKGFFSQIEEEVSREIGSNRPRVEPGLLRHEAERREQWTPFYGFSGGGDVLCLDSEGKVQFYQAMDWTACPDLCSFVLADSLPDFVERWSKYSFVAPGSSWTSFCWGRSGIFDWSPGHFPRQAARGRSGGSGHEK
jgi:hypothetical protein